MKLPELNKAGTLPDSDPVKDVSRCKDIQFSERSAIQHLKSLHLQQQRLKYPNNPYLSSPDFKVSTTGGLTKAVIHFLKLKHHQAERVTSSGRYLDNSIISTNVIGQRIKIGSGRWIPGTSTNGSADISSTINSMSVKWEVKNKSTHDRQSEAQKRYQAEIENAGGKYYLITTFKHFLEIYYSNWED